MEDLTKLSMRITASLTRADLSADLEPELEEAEDATPDPDPVGPESNLTSGTSKWVVRPEWVPPCVAWSQY